MGAHVRSPALALIERLYSHPQGFNLFQAISLLERHSPERTAVGTGVGLDEAALLRASVSLAFAPSDVVSVQPGTTLQDRNTLTSAAMSLAGANGPLPLPFTEMLLQRRPAKDRAALDFLDIFQGRWLAFLYRSRKKHHIGLNWQAGQQDNPLARTIDALSGLGRAEGARGPLGEVARLHHAGLQNAAPRSMLNLLTLLSDRLGLRFKGRQFVGGWQDLDLTDQVPLGRAVLGQQAVLGRRAWDAAAGIELTAVTVSMQRMLSLLPGGHDHALMGWLLRRHTQSELQVRLVLQPDAQVPSLIPGLGQARLGWTSWLTPNSRPDPLTTLQPIRTRLTPALRSSLSQ
jgi:type VI secretion system protein ImpH